MTDGPHSDRDLSYAQLAVYAHELRGALTVIAGYSELLRRPLDEAERLASLDGIERAIRRADALCGAALAGLEPTQREGQPGQRVSLRELAEQVARDQRGATGRSVVVACGPDVTVAGDELTLTRMLENLVGNAAKYSPSDNEVEIRLGTCDEPLLGPMACIEVLDRGTGIPEEYRDRVFEPFARLDRDAEKPGTGLGLTVVREVAEAHGGAVRVDDREGGGSVVRVLLPG